MPIIITIKVKPNAGKQAITLDKTGNIVCLIKSPPEDGKANHELIKLLSKKLEIPQLDIIILQGAISRTKTIKINSYNSKEELFAILDLPLQSNLSHKRV